MLVPIGPLLRRLPLRGRLDGLFRTVGVVGVNGPWVTNRAAT